MIIALALLPDHLIESGHDYIEKLAMELGKKQDAEAADKAAKNEKKPPRKSYLQKWQDLFKYIRREWIKNVKPKYLSVFNTPIRTNNVIERYHRDLNDLLGGKPGVKKFISEYSIYCLEEKFTTFLTERVT